MADMQVAKTEYLLEIDSKEIEKYVGQIHGYKERLIELNKHSKVVLDFIQLREKEVAKCDVNAKNIQNELTMKNTSELVDAETLSVEEEWKFFTTQHLTCEISSPWKVAKHNTWANDYCEWAEEVKL